MQKSLEQQIRRVFARNNPQRSRRIFTVLLLRRDPAKADRLPHQDGDAFGVHFFPLPACDSFRPCAVLMPNFAAIA